MVIKNIENTRKIETDRIKPVPNSELIVLLFGTYILTFGICKFFSEFKLVYF